MIPLPKWMRIALFATAGMNILAAGGFMPAAQSMRTMAGFPDGGHPFYLVTVAMFVLLFGLAYLWVAVAGRAERFFIALAAAGKLSFVAIVVCFWATGSLPGRAPVMAAGDVLFGVLFLVWLFNTRGPRA